MDWNNLSGTSQADGKYCVEEELLPLLSDWSMKSTYSLQALTHYTKLQIFFSKSRENRCQYIKLFNKSSQLRQKVVVGMEDNCIFAVLCVVCKGVTHEKSFLTPRIPLHYFNCAHLGTGPLFKFNGIVSGGPKNGTTFNKS